MTTSFPDVPTVPAPSLSSSEPPTPRRRWPVVLAIALGFAIVILLLGTVIRLPYVIYSPGDATPVESIVRISGAKTYRNPGDVLFLTVAVSRERPNVWRWLQASLDDDSHDSTIKGLEITFAWTIESAEFKP